MSDAAAAAPGPPPRKRRWLRRTVLVLLLLVVVVRFGGEMALPSLLDRSCRELGLEIRYESLDLSLLTLAVDVRHLDVRRRPDPEHGVRVEPIAHVDDVDVDVDLLALMRGELRIEHAFVVGLEASVTRLADGGFAFGSWRLPSAAEPAPAAADDPVAPLGPDGSSGPRVAVAVDRDADAGGAAPLDFTLPIAIEQCSLSGVLLHLRDETTAPPFVTDVGLHFRASDVGSPQRRASLGLSLRAKEGALELTVDGAARGPRLDGRLALALSGVSTEFVRRLAPQAGLAPHVQALALDVGATVAIQGGEGRAIAGSIALDRLVVTSAGPDGGEELSLRARAELERLTRQQADVKLAVVDLGGRAVRLEDGRWRALGFDLGGAAPATAPSPPPPSAPPAAVAATPFRLRLREVKSSLALALRDETKSPPVDQPIVLRDVVIREVELGGGGSGTPPTIALAIEAAGASLELEGSLDAARKPPQLAVDLKVGHVEALLRRFGVDAPLQDGALELHLSATAQHEGEVLVVGAKLEGVRFHDGGRELARLDAVEVPRLVKSDAGIVIEPVRIVGPLVDVARDADGNLRIAGLALTSGDPTPPAATPPVAAAPEPAAPPASSSPSSRVELREVRLEGARVTWSDRAVAPPVNATLALDAKVSELLLGAPGAAKFELLAKIEGALEKLRLAGTADPSKLAVSADLDLDGVQLAALASYLPPELAKDLRPGRVQLHVDAEPPSVVVTSLVVDPWKLSVAAGGEPAGTPLDVAVALRSRAPLALWGADPGELPPLALELVAQAPPLAGELRVTIDAAPFAGRPTAQVTLDGKGLAGARLAEFFPAAAERVDASTYTDGTFHATLDVELVLRRRAPLDFDLRAGVGGSVHVADVQLRATPDGEPLAGVAAITAEVASVRPAQGDVILRSLEIVKPIALVRRTKEGLVVAGLLLKSAPPPAEPSPEPSPESSPAPSQPPPDGSSAPPPEPPAPAVAAAPGPEFRVDDLIVRDSGIQFVDETRPRPRRAPLSDLQLEVKHFTTRTLAQSRPLQYHFSAQGGDIELPVREKKSLVGKLYTSATDFARKEPEAAAFEKRPAWRMLDASGEVTLAPYPTGWMRLDVEGFELQAIQGLASASGIVIDDGVVDASVDVRLLGTQGLAVDSRTTYSYLSVHEPPNGPIASYLKLPMPLDSVLFLLRDENGQQQVPLRFKVDQAGADFGAVAKVASATLLRLIADAVKSAPTRALKGTLDATQLTRIPGIDKLTDLTSLSKLSQASGLDALFGDVSKQPLCDPVILEFEPGTTRLPADAAARAKVLLERMRKDKTVVVSIEHHLGEADRARLERLAHPSAADVAELLQRMRRRRDEVAARREVAAVAARGAMATGRGAAAAAALDEVRALERERTTVEATLDRLFERRDALERGDTSGDDRMLRLAFNACAELRLTAARDLVEESGVEEAVTRIQLRSPRASDVVTPGRSRIVITPRQRR